MTKKQLLVLKLMLLQLESKTKMQNKMIDNENIQIGSLIKPLPIKNK